LIINIGDQFVAKRKNEMFKRIKSSVVVKLIGENKNTESIYNLAEENNNLDNGYENSKMGGDTNSIYSHKTDATNKTSKTAVTQVTYATEMFGNLSELTFVLCDLRERSDYDHYHIKEAISYPSTNILRDKFSPEMYNIVRNWII